MTEDIQPGGLDIRGVEGSVQRHRRELTSEGQRDGGQGMDDRSETQEHTHAHLTDLEGLAGDVDF